MERRNSYTRNLNVRTSAARIAVAKNNREKLSLAKTSKRLSCQWDWSVRTFYKEKAKAYSFLQEVYDHCKNCRIFENGNFIADKRSGERNEAIRLPSINTAGETKKTERRHQKLSTEERTIGSQSRNKKMVQLKEKNTGNNVEEKRKENSELVENSKPNIPTPKPFKVRSRISGICYSCSYYHLPSLPSVSVKNMTRRYSDMSEDFLLNVPRKSSNSQFRKLSLPIIGRMSFDVSNSNPPSTGREG